METPIIEKIERSAQEELLEKIQKKFPKRLLDQVIWTRDVSLLEILSELNVSKLEIISSYNTDEFNEFTEKVRTIEKYIDNGIMTGSEVVIICAMEMCEFNLPQQIISVDDLLERAEGNPIDVKIYLNFAIYSTRTVRYDSLTGEILVINNVDDTVKRYESREQFEIYETLFVKAIKKGKCHQQIIKEEKNIWKFRI